MRADARPMRHTPRTVTLIGLLAGVLGGAAVGLLATPEAPAGATSGGSDPAPIQVWHRPPLLLRPGEPINLRFDVICPPPEGEEYAEWCDAVGQLFVVDGSREVKETHVIRPNGDDPAGRWQVTLPESVLAGGTARYYVEFRDPQTSDLVTLPAGGADAPTQIWRMGAISTIELGAHRFEAVREPDVVEIDRPWGREGHNLGLERGFQRPTIGPSSFDVDGEGTVYVLDQLNGRIVKREASGAVTTISVDLSGGIADLAVDEDYLYVLEPHGGVTGSTPLLKRLNHAGSLAGSTHVVDLVASQIRVHENGPVVRQFPSEQWMPATVGGHLRSAATQARGGRAGIAGSDGTQLVSIIDAREIRIAALDAAGSVTKSWVVTSGTDLAEAQLVEGGADRVTVVARVYTEAQDEFLVLVLDASGVLQRFSVDDADWAEASALSRFRLHGDILYQLRSDPAGAQVVSFDLGGGL